MAITLQFKRGANKSQLDSYGPLQPGEPCILTDEGVVYIGDGTTNYMIGQVASGTGNPIGSGPPGRMYVDTTSSGIWFYEASVGWMEVGSNITDLSQLTGTLDDIADGTSYQRVAATEVDSNGYVIRLNDNTYQVTASGAYTHINDATLHRIINDFGTSNIELWSSQKINDTISSVTMGIDWQDSVLDIDLCEPPALPSDGDRYIICSTASGGWAGYSNYVVEYQTASGGWVYIEPNKGFASYVEDESKIYLYNGTAWGPISDITVHNDLSGLQGGAAGEYYHLTNSDYLSLTTNLNETISDIVGSTVTNSGTGIVVTFDDAADSVYVALGAHAHTSGSPEGQVAHSSLTGIGTDDHHAQQHSVTSVADHTVTAASGYVLATVADNTLGMTQIDDSMMGNVNHDNLQGVDENNHHNRQHSFWSSADHTWGVLTGRAGNLFHINSGETAPELTDTVDGGTLV